MATTNTRRSFEQQDPTKGNFRAYKFFAPKDRDNPPAFTGSISLPGNAVERNFSLWPSRSKTKGGLVLGGRVTPNAKQQWDSIGTSTNTNEQKEPPKFVKMGENTEPFPVDAHHMVLFENPNFEKVTEGKKPPPKMFGYYNPGGDEPLVVISGFAHEDSKGNIMMLGPVETYDPNKTFDKQIAREEEEMGNDEPEIPAHMMPEKTAGRHRPSGDGPSR